MSEETVYLSNRGSLNPITLHTDRECGQLNTADEIVEKPRSVYWDDAKICPYCKGTVEFSDADDSGPWQMLEEADPSTAFGGDQ